MSKSFKYFLSTFTLLLASFFLYHQYSAPDLPLAATHAGWSSMAMSSTGEYTATLNRWASESEQFAGEITFTNLEGQDLQIARNGEINQILLKDNKRYLQMKGLPNTLNSVYTASNRLAKNESFPDVIICKARCLDVSAWFLLGDYLPQFKVKTFFSEYDSLKLGNIVTDLRLDSYFLRAWAEDVTYPTKITLYGEKGVRHYTNRDRIFVKGSRSTPAGEDSCVGYFDHRSEIKEDGEFTWFCYNEKFHLFSGDSKTAKLVRVINNKGKLAIPTHDDVVDQLSTGQLSCRIRWCTRSYGRFDDRW